MKSPDNRCVLLFVAWAVLAGAPAWPSAELESLLLNEPNTPITDAQLEEAGALLDDDDPFVRATAEWIISRKVETDNSGQELVWPKDNAPAWYEAWRDRPFSYRLACDYARQAMRHKAHHSGNGLLQSARKILDRAEGAAALALERDPARYASETAPQLALLRERVAEFEKAVQENPGVLKAHRKAWIDLRLTARPVALAALRVDAKELLFIKRHAAHSHRNITGSQYPWVHKPGGDIFRMALEGGECVPRPVLDGRLGPGHVHGMDLWWSGDRVVFGFARQTDWPPPWNSVSGDFAHVLRNHQEPTHLYEIGVNGEGLRQLTYHRVWNDFEPTYCADGAIVFSSDRSGRSSECGRFSADHTVINLHKLTPNGDVVSMLTDNKDIDRYPHSLDNGLIAYTRWDYQERHFMEVHSIWTIRPDGTMADAVFNQHLRFPYGLRDVRSVPGSQRLVAVATGHHTFAYGPVVLIDHAVGVNLAEAIEIVTPGVKPQEGGMAGTPSRDGGVTIDRGGVYQTPWALSENTFLAGYAYRHESGAVGGDNPAGFGLYYFDTFGNKELLHRDPLLSCSFPIPLKPRPRPAVLPDTADSAMDHAVCYVPDVYQGLEGVERGEVKFIRIAQRVGWPLDGNTGAKRWIPGNAWERKFGFWSWAPVRVIGTVPVASDGSACFAAPPDVGLYFQALDANRMELRRMRTHVTLKRGEVRGCTGCHETQNTSPASYTADRAAALKRPADWPVPPPFGNRVLLDYETHVQPVFDRHCVRCHGPEKQDGGLDFAGTRAADGFAQSFRTLFGMTAEDTQPSREKLVSVSDRLSDHSVSAVRQFGSHESPLIRVLLEDALHRKEASLSAEEWETLVTWVDANAPYYDTFFDKRPPGGGEPVRNFRLPPFPAFGPHHPADAPLRPAPSANMEAHLPNHGLTAPSKQERNGPLG